MQRFSVNLSDDLGERVTAAAAAEGRSVSNYITRRLELALDPAAAAAEPAQRPPVPSREFKGGYSKEQQTGRKAK